MQKSTGGSTLLGVRFRRLLGLLSLAVAAVLVTPRVSAQDFNPRGRKKPGAAVAPRPGGRTPTAPRGPAGSAPGRDADAGQSQAALIERYTKIVLSQPGAPFPLQRLAQLYRDKDGNLNALVKDVEARAQQAGPEQYASVVVLAGVCKLDARPEDAIRAYEKAIQLKSADPVAILALARLLQDRGDPSARKHYEDALAHQVVPSEREQTLRTLMTLALDAKDFGAAKEFHLQLVKAQPSSFLVKGELARELFQRAEYVRATVEFKDVVRAAQGDNRALPVALKDLGKAQALAHETQEARVTLQKALASAGQEAAVRAEIYDAIEALYRADQQLPVLIKQLEGEHPSDFPRLALLASLYEETGDSAKALDTYRRAVAVNPKQIDLRLKMIRVLQSQGELDKAIQEYEALIRAAPNNPQFVFDQCEALLQRGSRDRALRLLAELEARGQGNEEILTRVSDFYGRIGEAARQLKVLTRLAQVGASDPGALVNLGDRYFQDGNASLAIQTWKRILTTVTPRARALAALGEVFLEHDMTPDALASLKEAVQLEPASVPYKKQLASALERTRNFRESLVLWQDLAEKAKQGGDKLLAREARTRVVTLWGFEHLLEAQIPALVQAFGATPPDVEAGRTLAEVWLHARKLPEAETTLRRVISVAPGDSDSYLALERVLVQENKTGDAIAVLEKLVGVEPKRARELYQRMAQFALQLYRDEDAVTYAARAVELNPDDAEGHRRLGDMYRQRQDIDRAIQEYRAAISKNDHLFVTYLELAEILLARGQSDEADRLFRRVLRGAPDEELVARAARLSMQVNLGRATLESLELELLPLAIGNPQRKVFRRLLIEIYGNLTFALVQRSKHAGGAEANEARAALARIGGRAVKPLLDALIDVDSGQQRIAIDVLGYVRNKNAGASLFAFATGQSEVSLRARAMLACGDLRDPALLPKYAQLLFPKQEGGTEGMASDSVAVAATWAVAKLTEKSAVPLLRKIAQNGTPNMRAFAALGLGALKDKASTPWLASLARAVDVGSVARAAAAYALGELGATSETSALLALAEGTDILPRQMAILALGKLPRTEAAPSQSTIAALADAVFSSDVANDVANDTERGPRASQGALRRAATASLVLLATRGTLDVPTVREALPAPDESFDAESTLSQLVPETLPAPSRARALLTFAEPLERAAQNALATSAAGARAVLDSLGTRAVAFEPFVSEDDKDVSREPARAKARALAGSLEPSVLALARHPDPSMRAKALGFLSHSKSDAAAHAIASAVTDSSATVQRVAIAFIGNHADSESVVVVADVLRAHESWSMRVLAAQALGRLGASGARATPLLEEAAKNDTYALVREAALLALSSYDTASAAKLAAGMAKSEPEPRVRETAAKIRGAR